MTEPSCRPSRAALAKRVAATGTGILSWPIRNRFWSSVAYRLAWQSGAYRTVSRHCGTVVESQEAE